MGRGDKLAVRYFDLDGVGVRPEVGDIGGMDVTEMAGTAGV